MSPGCARSGGSLIVWTASRWKKSSRTRRSARAASRSSFVAAITQTSTGSGRVLPSRRTSPCSSADRSLPCADGESKPTSSRKSTPRVASWKRPGLDCRASVNAPRSYPNSSASIRFSGTAAQLMSTNGACARGPNRWMSRATRPLPLPVSPWIRMRGGRDARAHASKSRSTCPRTSTIAGLSPSSSAPSVTHAPPLRSGLGAALRDRPRELADQPRIALLDDLEAVVGVLDRVLAGPLLIPDLDDALVPPEEAPARGLERHARQLLLDPAVLPELELSVVRTDLALIDGPPDVRVDPVLACVVRAAGHGAQERHPLRRRLSRGDLEPERDSAVLEQSQSPL